LCISAWTANTGAHTGACPSVSPAAGHHNRHSFAKRGNNRDANRCTNPDSNTDSNTNAQRNRYGEFEDAQPESCNRFAGVNGKWERWYGTNFTSTRRNANGERR